MKLEYWIDIIGANTIIGLIDQDGLVIQKTNMKNKEYESSELFFKNLYIEIEKLINDSLSFNHLGII